MGERKPTFEQQQRMVKGKWHYETANKGEN